MNGPTVYPIHPLANYFPSMTEEEFAGLLKDMQTNGQREPATLYEGQVLDGRHRAKACAGLGLELRTVEYTGNDPLGYVVSCNLHRRHMTPGQKGLLAAKLPKGVSGTNRHTVVGNISQTGNVHGGSREPPSENATKSTNEEKTVVYTVEEAAKKAQATVSAAKRGRALLATGEADLIKGVEDGTMDLYTALKEAKARLAARKEAARPKATEAAAKVAEEAATLAAGTTKNAARAERVLNSGQEDLIARMRDGTLKVSAAEAMVRARKVEAELDPRTFEEILATLPKTHRDTITRAMRKTEEAREASFSGRVASEAQELANKVLIPGMAEKQAKANRIVAAHRGIFKPAEYNLILRRLHPDTRDDDGRTEAFQLFFDNKLLLLDPAPQTGTISREEFISRVQEREIRLRNAAERAKAVAKARSRERKKAKASSTVMQ